MHKIATICLFVGAVACGQLPNLGGKGVGAPNPPVVTISSVTLASAPNNEALARYFCPKLLNKWLCSVFGESNPADLAFVFDVTLNAANTNSFPLPAVEAMVAFTAYPDQRDQANVGAVCVALCPEGENCGAPPADGCNSAEEGIKSMGDFASAVGGFVTNVALGDKELGDVRVRTIPANTAIDIKIRLDLKPSVMLKLIGRFAQDALDQVKNRKKPSFVIPYGLEGTVWVRLESIGKIAASFGPHTGQWALR